jgi:hypothetical protein
MGYLDNSTITVDAILTKKGRELLAMGGGSAAAFEITQFALSDDEVDYDLWNPAHPLGSAYYGTVIENMPITEAVPDETQSMKYKLLTIPRGAPAIMYLTSNKDAVTVYTNDPNSTPQPPEERQLKVYTYFQGVPDTTTFNLRGGYHVMLLDTTYVTMTPIDGSTLGNNPPMQNTGVGINTSQALNVIPNQTTGVLTIEFNLTQRGKDLTPGLLKTTKVIINGNETGGRIVIPLTMDSTRVTQKN